MTFSERLRRLGFSSYEQYLKSPHWKAFSRKHKQKQCFCCSERRSAWSVDEWDRHLAANTLECERMIEAESDGIYYPDCELDLHHITYERIGSELADDVVTVCDICHPQIHRVAKFGGIPLREAHFVIRQKKMANRRDSEDDEECVGPLGVDVRELMNLSRQRAA